MKKKIQLTSIESYNFFEGMYIENEIYYKYKENYVLLCRDVVLTSELMLKLRQTEQSGQPLYVGEEYFHAIVEQGDYFRRQKRERDKLREERKKQLAAAEMSSVLADSTVIKKMPVIPAEPEPTAFKKAPVMLKFEAVDDIQSKIRVQEEYLQVTTQTASMMSVLAQTDQVPMEMGVTMTQEIQRCLNSIDPSVLIQCINNLRQMDDYLNAHSTNVAMLNGLIGRWMDLPQELIDPLILTGLLHDLGKLYIAPEILNKPARLSAEEFALIRKHPDDSFQILLHSGYTDPRVLMGVRQHHERANGTGYPDKLMNDQISLFARITAVSDVYDAMVAKRPYQERRSPFEVLAQFATSRFSDLDLEIVDVFITKMPQELIDKRVILSDGRTAKVVYINPTKFAYPIVRIGQKLISTSPTLKCVAMDNFISILN